MSFGSWLWKLFSGSSETRKGGDVQGFAAAHGLEISTATESEQRAARVLPIKGSEDVSCLVALDPREDPPWNAYLYEPSAAGGEKEAEDYAPSALLDFVIDLRPRGGRSISRGEAETLQAAIEAEWAAAMLHGVEPATGRWTYAVAAGVEGPFSQLASAMFLVRNREAWVAGELEAFSACVHAAARGVGEFEISPREPIASAVARSARLVDVQKRCSGRVEIILAAPSNQPFNGRDVWDVMLCLGLRWGDMDCFHRSDPRLDVGDDAWFSVENATEPGYFLPEEIAANRLKCGGLVFSFSAARCTVPEAMFAAMQRAAEYARKRLGGSLIGSDLENLDPEAMRGEIGRVRRTLAAAGLKPGQGDTLRLI